MKTKKGFTLIELIIVTTIIGMLALGGYPVLKSLKKDRHLKSEAQLIISNINYIRYFAVSEGGNYILRFSSDGKYYTLEKQSDGSILRKQTFGGSVVFDVASSTNMIAGALSTNYISLTSQSGVVAGLVPNNDVKLSLKSGESAKIFVKIVPGRKEQISWTP